MRRKFWFVLLLISLIGIAGLSAQVNVSGYVENRTGAFLRDDTELSQFDNILDLKFDYMGDWSAANAEVFLKVHDRDNTDDGSFNAEDYVSLGVREIYMDLYFDSVDFRIGKQKIIWGKADGVFITDIVSPLDMRSFMTESIEDIRQGVTAVKMDWYPGPLTVELIWVPLFKANQLPSEGSDWDAKPGVDIVADDINVSLDNSEGFAKISYIGSGFDFDIMGGYMYDDNFTVYEMEIPPSDPKILNASYNRVGVVGASFSSDIAGLVFRGEGAFYIDKTFTTTMTTPGGPVPDGTVEKNLLHYMFGLDYAVGGFNFGTQFIQKIIFDYDDSISAMYDQYPMTMTFFISKKLLRDTMRLEFFSYYGIDDADAMLRFRVYYDIVDALQLIVGSDVFVGNEDGFFGQYKDNTNAYVHVKYSF